MDAVKFFEESKRMCRSFNRCTDCPLVNFEDHFYPCKLDGYIPESKEIDKVVSTVEKWSEENPVKTRQSEFLNMFPDAKIGNNGILVFLPCEMDKTQKEQCDEHKECQDCCKKYWLAEVE